MTNKEEGISSLFIEKEIIINAPIDIAFAALLQELGPNSTLPDGSNMKMKIEPWPGGRWYRDLGNNAGHLWAHVQVIKPPGLLELTGQMFMSFAAVNHLQYRLKEENNQTKLVLIHRAIGQMPAGMKDEVTEGWSGWNESIKKTAEKMAKEAK